MSRHWLFCLTDGYGGYGGIAQFNRDLLGHIAELRPHDRFHVLQRSGTKRPPADLPPNVVWHAPCSSRVGYALGVAWLMWRLRPLVFCGHLYMAPLIAMLSGFLRLPWWLQLHGIEVWQSPTRRLLVSVGRANFLTTVSRFTRAELLKRVPLAPWRVRVLPNTAYPMESPDQVIRQPHMILSITRLTASERYKGVQRVLAVLPSLCEMFPDLRYVVAGDGDDLPWLQAEAVRLGVGSHVHFTGRVSADRKAELLATAGVFVLPSSGEGFGIVFVEAATAGGHVVAGNRDGSVDALADGALGMLVDPFDPLALSAALHTCLVSPPPAGRASAVAERFSPDVVRELLEAFVQQMEVAYIFEG